MGTVPNFRDLGGWPARGGRIRSGLIFRSAEFANLEGDDLAAFERFGIRSVYDFRTADERKANPNILPAGTEYIVLDILAGAQDAAPAAILKATADPKTAGEVLGGGKAVALLEDGYRQIAGIPSALTGYRQFFSAIAQPEHRPASFHCTTGKDRTGWAAASFLLLMGVSEEDVLKEYLLTNEQLVPAMKPLPDKFKAAGGDPEILMPLVGVQQSYLGTALHEMRTRWGSIEGYFSEGLGLDGTTIDRLCTSYIEEASPTSDLTAIDILVEPDDTMKAKAGEINERMLKSIPPPAGFSLDEHHQPHITTEQCFVHTEAIHHLVEDKAKGVGIAFVVCKPGPELLDFQAELIDAVRPFTGSGGTAEAFVRTEAERDINPEGIAWAEDFVRDHSGADYFAHVTVGLAMLDDLKVMEAEPLEPLTFGAAGLAVHQLGNQGTAAKLLKSWRA
ncbi:tyrosine-protein phosphatase [Streptomyces canus]